MYVSRLKRQYSVKKISNRCNRQSIHIAGEGTQFYMCSQSRNAESPEHSWMVFNPTASSTLYKQIFECFQEFVGPSVDADLIQSCHESLTALTQKTQTKNHAHLISLISANGLMNSCSKMHR